MSKLNFNVILFLLSLSVIANSYLVPAQTDAQFQYVNPVPNSIYVSANTNIIIRQGDLINKNSVSANILSVIGSVTGKHTGRLVLADDNKTLVFTPLAAFSPNEEVTVRLSSGLTTVDGIRIGDLTYKFHTCNTTNIAPVLQSSSEKINNNNAKDISSVRDSSLPTNLPKINIDKSNDPSDGYLFVCPSPYLMIVDNKGTPVFFRNVGGTVYDFDLQKNGEITYFIYPVNCYGLDSSLNMTSTYTTVNGYSPDVHDLRVLSNGYYYIFGKMQVTVDMSKIVSGGQTSATLIEGALQEFDPSGNLIFQWDALQHYKITDVDSNVDLTQPTIDYSHFNAVEIDTDGNLLISTRNLDEITKVDHNTGDIIWRLGGKNNEFKFINDNIGFSRQHDVRLFSNGDLSLFDNGVYHTTPVSSAVEYKLDEVNKTATLVRRISLGLYTDTEGSVEELSNGNRYISWGHNYAPFATEVKPNDSIAYQLSYSQYVDTYRSFRYNWQTNLFNTSVDSIDFGTVNVGDSLETTFTVYNPHDTTVTINAFYCNDSSFQCITSLPITLSANDSAKITVKYKPLVNGSSLAAFNIRDFSLYNGTQQMIAKQIYLKGSTGNVSLVRNIIVPDKYELEQNYPNPFNPSTTIRYSIPKASLVSLKIYDVLGNEVADLINKEMPAGNYSVNYNAHSLSSGVYFYRIQAGSFVETRKLVFMK